MARPARGAARHGQSVSHPAQRRCRRHGRRDAVASSGTPAQGGRVPVFARRPGRHRRRKAWSTRPPAAVGWAERLARRARCSSTSARRSSRRRKRRSPSRKCWRRSAATSRPPPQLDLFVSRIERATGPPAALPAPPPLPVGPGAVVVSMPSALAPEPTPEPVPDRPAPPVAAPPPAAVTPVPLAPAPVVAKPAPPAQPAASKQVRSQRRRRRPRWPARLREPILSPRRWSHSCCVEAGAIGWLVFGGAPARRDSRASVVIQSRPVAARVLDRRRREGHHATHHRARTGAHIVEVRVGRSEPRVIPVDVKPGVQNSLYSNCRAWRRSAASMSAPSRRPRRSPSTAARVASTPLVAARSRAGRSRGAARGGPSESPADGAHRARHDESAGRADGKPVAWLKVASYKLQVQSLAVRGPNFELVTLNL